VERVILLAKAPSPGSVKTRLAPPLTPEEASSLHEAMLRDQIAFVASLVQPGRTAELCLDTAWACEDGAVPPILKRTLQTGGDLGRKMDAALMRGHASGAKRIVLLGADAPTLPREVVDEAFARLRNGADAVVTPAADGGYVLIATGARCPALFRDVPWGTPEVLATTRRRAADLGIVFEETEPWYDVDRLADLPRAAEDLERHPDRAPATAKAIEALRLYLPEERVV
jgi:rSAM/selenodomain-associated transferase 1